ncbi:CppA N-terminal domain-containing protein [Streptococcus ruminantium]|uniref:CppA N-terminal domain-containing protein n=1 Tax=Streptococcus ruminantium TaxID=1917441 RepID=A0ABU1B594_9STRE|nr:CppA N-terminal domain-containing protein [Streptococcus ruminantium]MDQ8834003.1 CppA N-terminal domain-containing protein [Streptococcus ruminantium]
MRKNEAIVPVLRINNRAINLVFLEEHLGMKNKLEDGPFAELGDSSEVKLVLMESPGTRTRAVRGIKKLNKIVIKVDNAPEIETLLAQGTPFSKLYQGQNGYALKQYLPKEILSYSMRRTQLLT